eukprot:390373-Pleurochrysis_carterae.AAC.1
MHAHAHTSAHQRTGARTLSRTCLFAWALHALLRKDACALAQASSTGGDWQKAVIKRRGQGARARDKLRLESERQCAPLLDLYEVHARRQR